MGYDRYPERLIEEKLTMLIAIAEREEWVFYTHDPEVAASRIARDESGRFAAKDALGCLAWD